MELQVDLGDLQNEKERLTSFLQLHLKVSVSQVEGGFRNGVTAGTAACSEQVCLPPRPKRHSLGLS